jgi:hypothetical protein
MIDLYRLEPHIGGDWRVIKVNMIDVTSRDSIGKTELIEGAHEIVFIGSLDGCEKFMKKQND